MNELTTAGAVLLATTSLAAAGGIDRSNQFIGPLFEAGGETGSYVQLSIGKVDPKTSAATLAGGFSSPLKSYLPSSLAVKSDLSEQLSFGVIVDEPFGVSVSYAGTPLAGSNAPAFPNQAEISSQAVTGILRYKFNDTYSIHADLRGQTLDVIVVSSSGILQASSDRDWGYLVGVAYERPEIALRIAVTYNSEMAGTLDGSAISNFVVTTPESLNIEFQTGIAKDTLLFGTIRHAKYDGFNLTVGGAEFVNFDNDTTDYSIGPGRRLTDQWSIAATYSKGEAGKRPGDTLLAPTNRSDIFA